LVAADVVIFVAVGSKDDVVSLRDVLSDDIFEVIYPSKDYNPIYHLSENYSSIYHLTEDLNSTYHLTKDYNSSYHLYLLL
jgi:hypothetical protein